MLISAVQLAMSWWWWWSGGGQALVSKQNHENHRRYLKQKQDAETQHLDDEHERRHQAILVLAYACLPVGVCL